MGRISALTELTSLANDDYLLVLDSSANIAKKITVANAFGIPDIGWTATGETWTFSSWTLATRTGEITVPTDATTKYTAGMRIKITQSTGGTKYGIITKVAATVLTVFFPTGTVLENETISTPFYSSLKVPYGFDINPDLWIIKLSAISGSADRAAGAYLNVTSMSVPVGTWTIRGQLVMNQDNGTAEGQYSVAGFSTSSSSFSHDRLKVGAYIRSASTSPSELNVSFEDTIIVTSTTTFYVIITTAQVGGTTSIGVVSGQNGESYVAVKCAYL